MSVSEQIPTRGKVGFVYVVQMVGHPLFKIGRSVNVPRRMSEFGVLLPFPFELILAHRVLEHEKVEKTLHKHFSTQRTNGEWFQLSAGDLQEARSLLLSWQATALKHRLIRRFLDDLVAAKGDISNELLMRYARVFAHVVVRVDRREHLGLEPLPITVEDSLN